MKKKGIIRVMVILVLCLCACGRQEDVARQSETVVQENVQEQGETNLQESSSGAEETYVQEGIVQTLEEENGNRLPDQTAGESQVFDWRNAEWKIGKSAGNAHNLYAVEYLKGLESTTQREYRLHYTTYKVWGHRIYELDRYCTTSDYDSEYFYYMNYYDALTGEFWHQSLELPCPEEYEGYDCYIEDFDIQDEQEWVLFLRVKTKEEVPSTLAYEAIHFTPEGEILSRLDLYPFIRESVGERGSFPCTDEVFVDSQGYYYLNLLRWELKGEEYFGHTEDKVYILDQSGELVEVMVQGSALQPYFAIKTPDGYPVFIWQRTVAIYYLVFYDEAQQKSRQLAAIDGYVWSVSLNGGMLTEDGYLYYYDREKGLHRCNLVTEERDCCLKYGQLGLGSIDSYIYTIQGADGEPVVIDTSEGEAVICRLGTQKPESDPLRLVSFTDPDSYLENSAVQFSKSDLTRPIEIESPVGDEEDYRSRMLAELAAGKGADIYYVSAEDMQILYEKGVLAELTEVLSEEILESVYPGVLDGGLIDGRQIGLAPEAWGRTMLAADKYWEGDSWTLEELLNVIDAHPEIPYPIVQANSYMDGYKILRMLLFQDMGNTPFLDTGEGSCNFEDPLFIRVLELAKYYQDNPIELGISSNLPQELLEEGSYIAVIQDLSDFPIFSSNMAAINGSVHLVGFPTEGSTGSYWQTEHYLVVNRQTEQPERVYAFLEYLFRKENQSKSLQFVRRDILGDRIVSTSWEQNSLQYRTDDYTYYLLETKPDGSSWQEEYEEILDQCVLVTGDSSYIQEIIMEEVKDYFDGIKDAGMTAELIQNRVQLYLKERGTAAASTQGKGNQWGNRNG